MQKVEIKLYGAKAQRSKELDPTDMAGLQQLIDAKRRLQELKKLHISL